MRVALISFHRGGMAHYAAMLARALVTCPSVTRVAGMVCEDFPGDGLPAEVQRFGFSVPHSIGPGDWGRWLRAPGTIAELWRHVQAWQPDVVHVNSGHLWYNPLVARLARSFPLVYTLHDVRPHAGAWHPYERLKVAPLLRRADCVILHSEALRRQACDRYGLPADRTATVPCGLLRLPSPADGPATEEPGLLLLPGRVRPYKGYEVLLDALPQIVAAVPEVRVAIVGQGSVRSWRSRLDRHAERVTVVNRFLSEPELLGWFERAGVVVLPYRSASQSGVALMAAACGKPVVASRVGAIPEVVEDGVTGRLVAPDRPAELAEAVVGLLQDPERRRRMGAEARRRCEQRFGDRATGRRHVEIYERVMARRRAHAGATGPGGL